MDQKEPPEFMLDVFADPRSLRDVVKGKDPPCAFMTSLARKTNFGSLGVAGILHTIFFNRFFPSLVPKTRDVLGVTLPYVDDDELQTMIEQRVAALDRQLDAERSSNVPGNGNGGRGQVAVHFFEKRRRKAWLARGDEEVCWECWTVKVTVAEPRTESERAKVRNAMEQTLRTTAIKIVTFANTHKDHIPPITTQGANPFPYKINIDQKETGWATRMGIY